MAFPLGAPSLKTTNDYAYGISKFSDGSSIITGSFHNTVTFGSTTLTASGVGSARPLDGFVAKIDSNGNFLWTKQLGGPENDVGRSVSTLSDGSSIITGYFKGAANFGDITLNSSGDADIFITKVDSNGNFLWATQAGSASGRDGAYSIKAFSDGSSIITGNIQESASFGDTTLRGDGTSGGFIAKLDSDGNFLWATEAGTGWAASTLSDGSSIITGTFPGSQTFGGTTLSSDGWSDIFITKVDDNGNFLWAKQAGGARANTSYGISTLSDGSSIITGNVEGSASFGDITLTSLEYNTKSIHIAKLDSNGNFLWATGGSHFSGYADANDITTLDRKSVV